MGALPSLILVLALLDAVMLAVVGLQSIWRQRVAQLVIVAVCTAAFTLAFVAAAVDMIGRSYVSDRMMVFAVLLYLRAAASTVVLVYLIKAVSRARAPQAYAARVYGGAAGHPAAPPPPAVLSANRAQTAPNYAPPPPIPAARAAAPAGIPLWVGIVVACVFAASILLKAFGWAMRPPPVTILLIVGVIIDIGMVSFGIFMSKLPYRQVQFWILLAIVLILGYFFLTSTYVMLHRFSYMARHYSGLFYLSYMIGFLRVALATTAAVFCGRAAFGAPRPPGVVDPRAGAPSSY